MELDRYLRVLGRYWHLPALLAVVGLFGTWTYLQSTGSSTLGSTNWAGAWTASASVAVLEPAVTRALSGQQAQINFASVAESRTVAERVARRLGLDARPDIPPASVSVKLARTLVPSVPTPLYLIQVQHRDAEWAVAIANAYVEEARELFIEMNSLEPSQVDAGLKLEEDRIRSDIAQARAALQAFEEANTAWRLNAQIDTQVAFVNALRQTSRTLDIGTAAVTSSRPEVERSLAVAQLELTRLRGLQPEYERLGLDVTLLSSSLTQLASRESDLTLLGESPTLAAVRAELATTRLRLTQARNTLASFQATNSIGDLSADIASRTTSVADLRRQLAISSTSLGGLAAAIVAEEGELLRLRSLLPEYERLATPVSTGEAKLGQLQLRKVDIVIAGSLPPGVQVKILDEAHAGTNTLWAMILYLLGAVLGIMIGLALVFLIGYFDRTPESTAQVEELVGAPVLARISRAW